MPSYEVRMGCIKIDNALVVYTINNVIYHMTLRLGVK